MARAANILIQLSMIAMLSLIHNTSLAQNEIAREQSSLKGIQSMAFTVNVESNASLTQRDAIQVPSLQQMGQQTLREGDITVIPDSEVQQSDEVPFLYMHINTMDTGQGLIPFTVSLFFYQPVKLILNRDLQTSSVTWETSTLGIVSYDRMALIREAAKGLLEEFVSDFNQINEL